MAAIEPGGVGRRPSVYELGAEAAQLGSGRPDHAATAPDRPRTRRRHARFRRAPGSPGSFPAATAPEPRGDRSGKAGRLRLPVTRESWWSGFRTIQRPGRKQFLGQQRQRVIVGPRAVRSDQPVQFAGGIDLLFVPIFVVPVVVFWGRPNPGSRPNRRRFPTRRCSGWPRTVRDSPRCAARARTRPSTASAFFSTSNDRPASLYWCSSRKTSLSPAADVASQFLSWAAICSSCAPKSGAARSTAAAPRTTRW